MLLKSTKLSIQSTRRKKIYDCHVHCTWISYSNHQHLRQHLRHNLCWTGTDGGMMQGSIWYNHRLQKIPIVNFNNIISSWLCFELFRPFHSISPKNHTRDVYPLTWREGDRSLEQVLTASMRISLCSLARKVSAQWRTRFPCASRWPVNWAPQTCTTKQVMYSVCLN